MMVSSLNNTVPRVGFAEDIATLTKLGLEYVSLVLGLDWHTHSHTTSTQYLVCECVWERACLRIPSYNYCVCVFSVFVFAHYSRLCAQYLCPRYAHYGHKYLP